MSSLWRNYGDSQDSDLVAIIHQVRRRWRLKLALRGVVLIAALLALALALVALIAAAFGLESSRFSPGSIVTFRVLLGIGFAAIVAVFFVLPLLRRVTDQQVALYLEEHEPSLHAELISAVEADAANRASGAEPSPLVRRLVQSPGLRVPARRARRPGPRPTWCAPMPTGASSTSACSRPANVKFSCWR